MIISYPGIYLFMTLYGIVYLNDYIISWYILVYDIV